VLRCQALSRCPSSKNLGYLASFIACQFNILVLLATVPLLAMDQTVPSSTTTAHTRKAARKSAPIPYFFSILEDSTWMEPPTSLARCISEPPPSVRDSVTPR
jgi:hypothetical protein